MLRPSTKPVWFGLITLGSWSLLASVLARILYRLPKSVMGRQFSILAWSPDLGIRVMSPLLIHFPPSKHCRKGLEKDRGDLFYHLLKKFRRDAVASRRLIFGHRRDGFLDFLQRELFCQLEICLIGDPGRGAVPAYLPGFGCAEHVGLRGVQARVKGSDIMGQVLLARDVPSLDFELFERCAFPPDSVEIKEQF